MESKTNNMRELPTEVAAKRDAWDEQRRFWSRWRYALGGGSIVFSAAITPVNLGGYTWLANALSVAAAVLTGFLGFSKAAERSRHKQGLAVAGCCVPQIHKRRTD